MAKYSGTVFNQNHIILAKYSVTVLRVQLFRHVHGVQLYPLFSPTTTSILTSQHPNSSSSSLRNLHASLHRSSNISSAILSQLCADPSFLPACLFDLCKSHHRSLVRLQGASLSSSTISAIIVSNVGLHAKICYFGAAFLAGDVGIMDKVVEGTAGYLESKVIAGARTTGKSDVYTFRVVFPWEEKRLGENEITEKDKINRDVNSVMLLE